jgi:hypothetical protein
MPNSTDRLILQRGIGGLFADEFMMVSWATAGRALFCRVTSNVHAKEKICFGFNGLA